MFLIIFLLIYNETYIQRMRHCIASYFYPKREKERILYLYNKFLKKRRGLFKILSANVKEQIEAGKLEQDFNILIVKCKCFLLFPKLNLTFIFTY